MRNTKQKEIVLNNLRMLDSHPTADELYQFIQDEHSEIGVATVYRNLSKLAENGDIKKITGLDGSAHYDWQLEPHYHMVCECCGGIHDVLAKNIPDLISQAEMETDCKILSVDITFRGLCKECQEHLEKRMSFMNV